MRLLSSMEISSVIGGLDATPPNTTVPGVPGPDILVTGKRDYYTGGIYQQGSYGSSDPWTQAYLTWAAAYYQTQAFDQRVDAAAKVAAHDLIAKGDLLKHQEFSLWLYADKAGVIHESEILPGNADNVGSHTIDQYKIPDGSILVGFMHNHPDYLPNSDSLNPSRVYADNADLGQVLHANTQAWVNTTVNQNDFRGYIVHDNTMDEYDYASIQASRSSIESGISNWARPDIKPNSSVGL